MHAYITSIGKIIFYYYISANRLQSRRTYSYSIMKKNWNNIKSFYKLMAIARLHSGRRLIHDDIGIENIIYSWPLGTHRSNDKFRKAALVRHINMVFDDKTWLVFKNLSMGFGPQSFVLVVSPLPASMCTHIILYTTLVSFATIRFNDDFHNIFLSAKYIYFV